MLNSERESISKLVQQYRTRVKIVYDNLKMKQNKTKKENQASYDLLKHLIYAIGLSTNVTG